MVIATVVTRNFNFTALGTDRKHAILILQRAWKKHRSEYAWAEPNFMDVLIADQEVDFVEIPGPGVALRDNEILIHHTH